MRLYPILYCAFGLLACTPLPDLGPSEGARGEEPYPRILPLGALLAPGNAPSQDARAETEADIAARLAALRARAARLRGPVLDRQTTAKLNAARTLPWANRIALARRLR